LPPGSGGLGIAESSIPCTAADHETGLAETVSKPRPSSSSPPQDADARRPEDARSSRTPPGNKRSAGQSPYRIDVC